MAKKTWEQLTPEVIDDFLDGQREKNRGEQTIETYRRSLTRLYQWLPEEKRLTAETGRAWKAWMEEQGVSARSVNSRLSALNSLCGHLGRREFQTYDFLETGETIRPELTRAEYLHLLQAAKTLEKERTFLLIKTLGGAGVRVQELPQLTVRAVRDGQVELTYHNGKCSRISRLPQGLREELLDYARREGIPDGPLFRDNRGKAMSRTCVNRLVQEMSGPARVEEEKATPRCLWNMYLSTRDTILSSISVLAEQAYDRMLEEEQRSVGWAG